jgi:hypothetical protein
MAPYIQTYHCICSSLLLATTHQLSKLPRRAAPSLDNAVILPVANFLPSSTEPESDAEETDRSAKDLPVEGYTKLLGMVPDKKVTVIRREDGFERRVVWRCIRCAVSVAYEILGDGKEQTRKVVYVLPSGVMSTEVMVKGRQDDEGSKLKESDLELGPGSAAVIWE